jgi:hypothetical protein
MPNGDYSLSHEDWEKIRAFFEELSPILLGFAAAHNLAIDKYYHDGPAWTLRFQHPKGGGAGIGVHRVDDDKIRINKLWYIDEYETFTHSVKSDAGSDLLLGSVDLREILEESLREVTAWNRNDMTAYHGYEEFWARYTQEEWHQMSPAMRLPKPTL